MECIEALEIVSLAMDREPVDARALAAAKAHCRECPECASMVRALVAVNKAALPEPPSDLADRVVAAVRAEHARAQRAAEALAAAGARERSEAGAVPDAAPNRGTVPLGERLRQPRYRRAFVAWSSAAAVTLIAAGFGAVYGARAIMTDRSPQTAMEAGPVASDSDTSARSDGSAGVAGSGATALSTQDSTASTSVSGLVVVEGTVYRSAGVDASVTREKLTLRGSTKTALAPDALALERDVYGGEDPLRVFIESDDGSMLAFDRVSMSYEGRTYVLQSAPIGEWGSAASLPSDKAQPVSADGSPTFQPADDTASNIFVLRGRDASSGIALPPGARPDVAQGWSWWVPVGQ